MTLAFLIYHAASRRTLNPALVLGSVLIVAFHVGATLLYFWEGWIEISRRIVGV